jgi:hypothetical protein
MRLLRIAPLLALLFALRVPLRAVEARASVKVSGGSVNTGTPLSGSGVRTGQLSTGLTAPGLLPDLKASLGTPQVQERKTSAASLPLAAPWAQAPDPLNPVQPVPALPVAAAAAQPSVLAAPAAPGGVVPVAAAPGSAEESRGPPAEEPALIQRARRYIRDIMGTRTPTETETEALLTDFMELRGLAADSAQGRQLRGALLASKLKAESEAVGKLDPRYRRVGPFILAAAEEYGVSPAQAVAAVEKRKLGGLLAGASSREQAERILDSTLARDRFDRFLARYPKSRQGELMREVAGNMLVRSGKSIEEVSRDGVFVYADFAGRSVTSVSSGRDPDPQTPNVLFYVRFEDSKWRIDVYRQNRGRGFSGGSDASYVDAFRQWLMAGGVPKEHIR